MFDTCTCQERPLHATDWNDFFIYWDVDGSYEIVRLSSVVLIAVSLSCCRQTLEQQSIEWNADFIYWPIDGAHRIVRCCRFE
jgi:hypothetical protein